VVDGVGVQGATRRLRRALELFNKRAGTRLDTKLASKG